MVATDETRWSGVATEVAISVWQVLFGSFECRVASQCHKSLPRGAAIATLISQVNKLLKLSLKICRVCKKWREIKQLFLLYISRIFLVFLSGFCSAHYQTCKPQNNYVRRDLHIACMNPLVIPYQIYARNIWLNNKQLGAPLDPAPNTHNGGWEQSASVVNWFALHDIPDTFRYPNP